MCVVAIATVSPQLPRPYLIVGLAGVIGFACLGSIRSIARYDLLLPFALWLATARITWPRIALVALATLVGIIVCQRYFAGTLI
jgi:hypothetical protein